jgi:hypothetical protein
MVWGLELLSEIALSWSNTIAWDECTGSLAPFRVLGAGEGPGNGHTLLALWIGRPA